MAKKTISPIRQEYIKQRNRIENVIKRYAKQGYIVDDIDIPDIPKRVTKKKLKELEYLTTPRIREKIKYVDIETGEIKRGIDAVRFRNELKKRKKESEKRTIPLDTFNENIINNFFQELEKYPAKLVPRLRELMKRIINRVGVDRFVEGLENMPDTFYSVLKEVGYPSDDAVREYATRLLRYIPDVGNRELEEMEDAIQESEYWTEEMLQ